MGDKIVVYISSVSGNLEIKKQQQSLQQILTAKKVDYEAVDISLSDESKAKMREIAGPKTLPPQFTKGDVYLGNYDKFSEAVECETLNEFLQLS